MAKPQTANPYRGYSGWLSPLFGRDWANTVVILRRNTAALGSRQSGPRQTPATAALPHTWMDMNTGDTLEFIVLVAVVVPSFDIHTYVYVRAWTVLTLLEVSPPSACFE